MIELLLLYGWVCKYVSTATYTYDNNGNTLTRTSTDSFGVTRYTYNKFNQQTEAKTGGVAAKYAYNAQGLAPGIRTSKVVGVTTTYYLLDGDNVIGEVQGGSVSATYLRDANLIRKKVGSTLTYYEMPMEMW